MSNEKAHVQDSLGGKGSKDQKGRILLVKMFITNKCHCCVTYLSFQACLTETNKVLDQFDSKL